MQSLCPIVFAALFVTAVSPGQGADWPQWRGPDRTGQVEGEPWPERLDEASLTLQWRVPLGPSYSGPIVSDSLVFTTETKNKASEVVIAYDRITGEERWRAEWDGAIKVPFFASANGSWIRATPAYDGERLYVAGMRDVLVCLDAETGAEQWRVDFVAEWGTALPSFGFVSSPLVVGDFLFVQAGASVVKLDKRTGAVVWRVLREEGDMQDSAFSSPLVATLAGREQLVVQTREQLTGVDMDSGEVLWAHTVPSYRGMNILTPVVVGDTIFTSTYKNQTWLYRVTEEAGTFAVEEAWTNNAQGYMSTPVVIEGHVYLHLQNERFTCIDLASGERTWTSEPFEKYCSLVAQGDRILALDNRGRLSLIHADPASFEVAGRVRVSDQETWAHLAVSGDTVVIREQGGLAVYRWVDAR